MCHVGIVFGWLTRTHILWPKIEHPSEIQTFQNLQTTSICWSADFDDFDNTLMLVKKMMKIPNWLMAATGKAEQTEVIDRKCRTKWSTVEHVSPFQNCVNVVDNSNAIWSTLYCGSLLHCAEVLDLKCACTQNVSVGRGCFELRHGECSVCVNVSLTGGRTVQPCVHTQIRHPAHSTLLTKLNTFGPPRYSELLWTVEAYIYLKYDMSMSDKSFPCRL